MYECGTCDRDFVNWHAARQHMLAVDHLWACDYCDNRYFKSVDLWNHQQDEDHHAEYKCEACDFCDDSFGLVKRHMNQEGHWRQHWCSDCQKGFESENNLKAHLHSRIHRGNDITCPFCKRGFATATGVTHHLETGSCPSARSLNRDTILTEVRRRDPNHIITKRLITYHEPSVISATSASYNYCSGLYECYLCHKGFCELKSLNSHVNSPAHKEKVYHCPGRACSKEFRALAPLFNHLESESCGAVRFDTVQKNVGGILSGRRMIGFA